jgi:phage protein U
MYAQLGNIVFTGLFGFDNFSVDGDEAVFAEFPLIGRKSRLQKTGDTLQEISMGIKLHVEFCDPAASIETLRAAKANGEVLPLLMGNGRYIADYVIMTMPYTVDESFADGTIKQASVSLTIKEYVAYNKVEQKEQNARRTAFALGEKKPFILRPAQPVTIETSIASKVTQSSQQANKIDDLVNEVQNNPSRLRIAANYINQSCDKAVRALSEMNDQLDEAKELQTRYTGLKSIAESAGTAFVAIKNLYPFDNITDLKSSNTYLQGTMRTFNRTSTPLFQDRIVRH